MQRYRADRAEETRSNGSTPWYSDWEFGPSLALVKKCPCPDGRPRTVYVQGPADTFFSMPAATRIKGVYTRGVLTCDDDGYEFSVPKGDA